MVRSRAWRSPHTSIVQLPRVSASLPYPQSSLITGANNRPDCKTKPDVSGWDSYVKYTKENMTAAGAAVAENVGTLALRENELESLLLQKKWPMSQYLCVLMAGCKKKEREGRARAHHRCPLATSPATATPRSRSLCKADDYRKGAAFLINKALNRPMGVAVSAIPDLIMGGAALVGFDIPLDGLSTYVEMASEAAIKLGKVVAPEAFKQGQNTLEKSVVNAHSLTEQTLTDNAGNAVEALVEGPTSMPAAPMKNTEFFIDILLLIRSLQVRAALSRVLEDVAPPLKSEEKNIIKGCRLLIPDALNSPRMALGVKSTEVIFPEKAARILIRGGVGGTTEAGLAFVSGGITLFVSAGLKMAKLPSLGQVVSDKVVDSASTSRNMAMISFMQHQFDQIARELAPMYAKRPQCNVAITPGNLETTSGIFWEAPSQIKTAYLGAKNKNEWAMNQLLEASGGFGISPQGCESWLALARVLGEAVEDTRFLAKIAHETVANSYLGTIYAEKALQSVFIGEMSFTDPTLIYNTQSVGSETADRTPAVAWLGKEAQSTIEGPLTKDLGVWYKHKIAPSFDKKRYGGRMTTSPTPKTPTPSTHTYPPPPLFFRSSFSSFMTGPEAFRWHSRKIVLDCNNDGSIEISWYIRDGSWRSKSEKWVRAGTGHMAVSLAAPKVIIPGKGNPTTTLTAPKFISTCPGSVTDCVVVDLDVTYSMRGGSRDTNQLLALRSEKEGKPGEAAALFGAAYAEIRGECQKRAAIRAKVEMHKELKIKSIMKSRS